MREKNFSDISDAVAKNDNSQTAGLLGSFSRAIDDQVVFSNYSARAAAGDFIKRPMLIDNTDYGAGFFKAEIALVGPLPSDIFWDAFDLIAFNCPTA